MRRLVVDEPIVLFSAYVGPDLESAAQELDLTPVAKLDTQAVIRIVDSLGASGTGLAPLTGKRRQVSRTVHRDRRLFGGG